MRQTLRRQILQGLIQSLVLINEIRLRMAYGPLYEIRSNKSLAATRLESLTEQED